MYFYLYFRFTTNNLTYMKKKILLVKIIVEFKFVIQLFIILRNVQYIG